MPRIPVVAAMVVNNPEPVLKETSQKRVVLISTGLCMVHAFANLFGPKPKIGSFKITDLAIELVVAKVGLASTFGNPKLFGMNPPIYCPDMKNKSETINKRKEKNGKLEKLACFCLSLPAKDIL